MSLRIEGKLIVVEIRRNLELPLHELSEDCFPKRPLPPSIWIVFTSFLFTPGKYRKYPCSIAPGTLPANPIKEYSLHSPFDILQYIRTVIYHIWQFTDEDL